MEDRNQKPHRVSRKGQSGSRRSNGTDDEAALGVKCSRGRCRSWAAAAIADCVALCCCPCAVLNLLTLALVKVPWMIGRKCIGRSKKRRKKMNREREERFHHHRRLETVKGVSGGCCGGGDGEFDAHGFVVERDRSLTKEEEEEEEKTASFKGEDEARISARVEAERVWLELYQVGHLGFGRVSFTGIHQ